MAFWAELKRRKVVQVAAVYAVTAWLAVQVVTAIEAPLGLPGWVDSLVIVLLGIGFPIALILAWAFDVTPGGVKAAAPRASTDSAQAAPAFTYVVQGLVLLADEFAGISAAEPVSTRYHRAGFIARR